MAKKQSAKALAIAPTAEERMKKIEAAVERSVNLFGPGAAGTLRGALALKSNVSKVVDSGSMGLNDILGVGGYPCGRVMEIYGAESSGKTTLALHAIASVQASGGTAAFVDAEHALDPAYAEALGVNLDEMLISQPDDGETALNIVETLVESGIDIIVVDSVAALVPKAELEGNMGDIHMGLQARLMSQALRKLTGKVSKNNTLLIFINQTRNKIGKFFGSPITTSGGNALKFYASIRLQISRIGGLKKGEEAYGNRTKVKVVKNKVAPPFKHVEFDIIYGEGISQGSELVDRGVDAGIVQKKGAHYYYGDQRIGHGKQNVLERLRDDKELAEEIRGKLP